MMKKEKKPKKIPEETYIEELGKGDWSPEMYYRETLEKETAAKEKLADEIFADEGFRYDVPDRGKKKKAREDDKSTGGKRNSVRKDGKSTGEKRDEVRKDGKSTGGGKEKKGKKKKKKIFWKIVGAAIILLLVGLVAGVVGGNYIFKKKTGYSILDCAVDAKKIVLTSEDADFALNKTTRIYSESGVMIADLADGAKENYLSYKEIPKDVVNAFIAVEDRTFWENPGFDAKGMVRVVMNYFITGGGEAHGASTITQQLARAVFLSTEKSIERKVREIFIAYYLTEQYQKEQIMEYYINNCCFANNVYGIRDAAKTYFNKDVSELTLSETAYLCAIPNRPQYYDPFNNSYHALKRRNKILNDMLECGFITQEQHDQAVAQEITIEPKESSKQKVYNYPTTYAVDCVVKYMMELNGFQFRYHFDTKKDYKEYWREYEETYDTIERELYTGGYEVQTTLDLDATKDLQKILDDTLDFNDDVDDDTGIYELQGAITVIENETGKVKAVIGGRSQKQTKNTYSLNRAFQVTRQPGSTIKPLIVYTPAFDEKIASPSTVLRNIDVSYAYEHPDMIQKQRGKGIRLRSAVEQSLNGCALYLFDQVTPAKGLSYLEEMEFSHIVPDDYYLSSGLGGLTYGTNTNEMANAYYTLQQHGKYKNADCITSIRDYSGNELYREKESRRVYSRKAADTMTDVMQGVLIRGTGARMRWQRDSHGMTAAGKTGTTNDMKDGWFCGYSPYYTIAVWVGRDDSEKVYSLYGGTYPGSIWKESMLAMNGDRFTVNFQLKPITEEEEDEYEYKADD